MAALLMGLANAHVQAAETNPPQIEFEQGLQLLLEKDYAAAARSFERLYQATGSERVRLEWARADYLLQDYEQAQILFKAVLATTPPLAVSEKINYFLDDMSLAQGRLDYSFSLERDSNPRVIPSVRTFNLFGLPFEYKPAMDSGAKWGTNYRLAGSKGLDESRRWIASAGVLGAYYGEQALNKTGVDLHLTYRLQIEPRAELKISHEHMDMGGAPLYRYSWATLSHVLETPAGWRWNNELRHGLINFPTYSYQNSSLTSYRLAADKSVSQFASLGFELGWEQGRALERPYSYATTSQGLKGTYFSTSIASRIQLKWTRSNRRHAEADPLFGVVRDDKRNTIRLALEPASLRIAGLTPVVELGLEKNDSTLALSNYRRGIASVMLKRSY